MRARTFGGVSCDFYYVTWLPQEDLTFALIETCYSDQGRWYPLRGAPAQVDITVAYQEGAGGAWRRFPGRPSLITASGDHGEFLNGGCYGAPYVIRSGDEHFFYIFNRPIRRTYPEKIEKTDPGRYLDYVRKRDVFKIALARWPAGRTMGIDTTSIDTVELRFDGDENAGRGQVPIVGFVLIGSLLCGSPPIRPHCTNSS